VLTWNSDLMVVRVNFMAGRVHGNIVRITIGDPRAWVLISPTSATGRIQEPLLRHTGRMGRVPCGDRATRRVGQAATAGNESLKYSIRSNTISHVHDKTPTGI
jgi:hypothetical protein